MVDLLLGRVDAQHRRTHVSVGAGDALQDAGEVLGAGPRVRHRVRPVGAEEVRERVEEEMRLRVVVDRGGEDRLERDVCAQAVCRQELARHLGQLRLRPSSGLRGEGADADGQLRGLRDDVDGRARVEHSGREHDGVEDVEAAGDVLLQLAQERSTAGDGVERVLRSRGVAAQAADRDVEAGEGSHVRAGPRVRVPLRLVGGHVHAVRTDDGDPCCVEDALVEHLPGPVPALLARLEHEDDVAGQVGPVRVEEVGRADEAGDVEVVPARVHRTVRGGEVEPGLLLDGQRIHVAAQQDR